MMNFTEITAAIAEYLKPLFPALNVYAEIDKARGEDVGKKLDLVVMSGPFTEIMPPNYTYKWRVEIVIFYQPENAADEPAEVISEVSTALDNLLATWTGGTLDGLPVYLYEGKTLPIVPKKTPFLYEYHIPVTLFLQF
jgi:hypothetical protein